MVLSGSSAHQSSSLSCTLNDLPEAVKSHVLLFAEDSKLFKQITSEGDSVVLQEDNALDAWTEKWLLKFNADKYHVLTLGKIKESKHTHLYTISSNELDHVFVSGSFVDGVLDVGVGPWFWIWRVV